VSGFPVLLAGERISALVVGGGAVATRKALALLEAGATVRVVAPEVSAELRARAAAGAPLQLTMRAYEAADVDDATVVIAATDSRAVNARVARDALALRRLVNVADAPEEGNFVTAATHRAGALVVAVTAGGVPTAARRVRDAVAERFDGRYARAVETLSELRRETLRAGGPAAWREAAAALVGDDFCASVESGTFFQRVAAWR
jgi:precorrin-2 dehydrogenase/sirohydrochlorin ferrochelatase